MRILVVEDHLETKKLLDRVLREGGYFVDGAGDLKTASQKLLEGGYAAAVVDLMLPDGSGLDLCREMRARRDSTPVLVLTARGEVEDRVLGLDAGADDYLRKPFAVAELLARVRALLRRGPRLDTPVVSFGPLEIRLAERRVLLSGTEVALTAREFDILEVLLRHRGRVVTRANILQAVWGAGSATGEGSLDVLLGRLRRKLSSAGGEDPILTHRGLGYSIRHER